MGKGQCLQQMVLGKLYSYMQKNEAGPCSYTTHKKINSKWIKDVNVRLETIKTIEESTGSNFSDISCSNIFLDMSPEVRERKAKINYWDYIKNQTFCTAKKTIRKTKRQPTEWEKIIANDIPNKGLVSKIYKELIQHNTPKPNNPIKIGQKT